MALPYTLDNPRAASLGMIVLETDETLENETRRAIPAAASLHHTRIYSAPVVTPETLAEMAEKLTAENTLYSDEDLMGPLPMKCRCLMSEKTLKIYEES